MAWFRCGGSGIPASLKSGMNSVLNKKFGTSTTYDPAGWPADVNLLGPLPVKSASGAIASFADGADGVPVKSCSVSFLPSGGGGTPQNPISVVGVSGLSVTQLGKNVVDFPSNITTGTSGGLTFGTVTNGGITYNGQTNNTFAYVTSKFAYSIPSGKTFTFSRNSAFSYRHRLTLTFEDNTTANVDILADATSVTYTPAKNVTHMRVVLSSLTSGASIDDTVFLMLQYGSTATTYSAYVTPSVVTDTFGQTIYGGTRDLTTDKASVTYALLELAVADMNNSDNYPGWRDCGIKALGLETQFYNEKTNVGQGYSVNTTGSNDILFLPKNSYNNMTQTQWQTNYPDLVIQIAVPLATPTEITGLTPHEIDTLLGDNNIYADTGTTTVEYRADIDLALNP